MMMTMPFPIAVSARRLPEEEDGVAVAAVIIGHGHACSTACSMRHAACGMQSR